MYVILFMTKILPYLEHIQFPMHTSMDISVYHNESWLSFWYFYSGIKAVLFKIKGNMLMKHKKIVIFSCFACEFSSKIVFGQFEFK